MYAGGKQVQRGSRPNRQMHPTALVDQMHHRFPRPQIKRQLQLIRAMVGDQSANGLSLFGPEPPPTGRPRRARSPETPASGFRLTQP